MVATSFLFILFFSEASATGNNQVIMGLLSIVVRGGILKKWIQFTP